MLSDGKGGKKPQQKKQFNSIVQSVFVGTINRRKSGIRFLDDIRADLKGNRLDYAIMIKNEKSLRGEFRYDESNNRRNNQKL